MNAEEQVKLTIQSIKFLINDPADEIVAISESVYYPSWAYSICEETRPLQPGDLKKHYEPGINKGNIAYESFCSQMERWLKNGTIKVGMSIHKK